MRCDEITKALNKDFRGIESSTDHKLMVGSYGRWTAIRGVSDLDLLFIAPASLRSDYDKDGGAARILQRTKRAIQNRYPATTVRVDRLVVVVEFTSFSFDVQPVFANDDDSYSYPDTYSDAWKVTKPRAEIRAIREENETARGNLRRLCRMTRSWKNKHGVVMGGLLIDTLASRFFKAEPDWAAEGSDGFGLMCEAFFDFLAQEPDHEFYAAIGSGQRVKVKKRFQPAAADARDLASIAIGARDQRNEYAKWRAVFGRSVPKIQHAGEEASFSKFRHTEEFVEDRFPVDIRASLEIDCTVTQDGFRPQFLRTLLRKALPLRPRKKLQFTIVECTVVEPYDVRWKVLNRGTEAERRDCIRGTLVEANEGRDRTEYTVFRGEHVVECYIIKTGVVVARSSIEVPISGS
ncbi:nucleotide-binding domain-containing protein [Agrococcus sp. SGAir0287]|uniref:nucleotide-binding domain-containing protein n=1 Tax=Agrococcus sp. SGAir0287 TaxID=2070347 RepID=UPI001C30067F|nr:nucleotidyltransferase [Agrococcus sp. SGAir0287]